MKLPNVALSIRQPGVRAFVPPAEDLLRGGIVGVASVTHTTEPARPWSAWHTHGLHGFVLADVATLPFVPLRGMLGFFRVDDAVLAELERRAGGAR